MPAQLEGAVSERQKIVYVTENTLTLQVVHSKNMVLLFFICSTIYTIPSGNYHPVPKHAVLVVSSSYSFYIKCTVSDYCMHLHSWSPHNITVHIHIVELRSTLFVTYITVNCLKTPH